MGFDCGFDVNPRLEATTTNKQKYQQFIEEIVRTYTGVYDENGRRSDGKILEMPGDSDYSKDFIRFMIGECPDMPSNPDRCNYFLRFSSKVSGKLSAPAEPYIKNVCKIAKRHFGSSVHFWHEMNETEDERQWGCYGWTEVHEATRALRELEAERERNESTGTQEGSGERNDERSGSSV